MLNSIKVLDCTLRDGGYYTNWDFSRSTVILFSELVFRTRILVPTIIILLFFFFGLITDAAELEVNGIMFF